MSARPRTTTNNVQRPTLPRAPMSRLFLKGTRVLDAFFSMLDPFGYLVAAVHIERDLAPGRRCVVTFYDDSEPRYLEYGVRRCAQGCSRAACLRW